ncbi:uncharacterized protein E5676_scaffold2119G00760 [Cucumis melo var. makuwa]|uniref:Uncharacterized protein n=1 Tax=Cucumis melo var. makuwa TaxID=1194695 RepID=A0A5D3BWL7_CUCMM|nr:uncharacterized protein E5676_scaffold2119G00760 [Cucumis melo var. makuwa]
MEEGAIRWIRFLKGKSDTAKSDHGKEFENEEAGQSGCSPPVRSLIQVDPLVDDQPSVPDSEPVGESTKNLGGNFAAPTNQNSVDVDARVKPTDTYAHDNVEPDLNVEPQLETQQSPGESRPKGKKFKQNRQNIMTKASRKKIPPNIPSIPIDGISFHLEDSVQRWKYVVQWWIAN